MNLFRLVLVSFALLGFVSAAVAYDEEVMTTDEGAPLRVVVSNVGAAIYEKPDETSANRPVKQFDFFFVLKPGKDAGEHAGSFYRVASAPREDAALGWIHAKNVVEWSHRQAIGLRPIAGRQLAQFYETQEELIAAYSGEGTPTPLSREPKGGVGFALMPILEAITITSEDGDELNAYRVAYLHGKNVGGGGPGIDLSKSTLDIVFVVDTTGSMAPYIDAVKDFVREISKVLPKKYTTVPVRFGLVGYRDVIDAPNDDWYVTKVLCDLDEGSDHGAFEKCLAKTDAAAISSEDFEEDVLAGLRVGIEDLSWNPDGFKQIVLLGDASAQTGMTGKKNKFKETIEGTLARAQPTGGDVQLQKVVHTIRIIGDEPADHAICERHFKQIANGTRYPGWYRAFDADDTSGIVSELTDFVTKSAEALRTAMEGKTPPPDTPWLGLIGDMVKASELSTDVKQFTSGFVCEIDLEGNQMLEPYVLARKGQLSIFDSALDFTVKALKNAGEPGKRSVGKLVSNIQILATSISMDEPIDAKTPLSKVLNLILGFPVKNKIFEMSFAKLAAMTEADFQSWVKGIEASRSITRGHLETTKIWKSLGSKTKTEDEVCFLKVKDLP